MDNIYEQLAKLSPQQRKLFERRLRERGIVIPEIDRISPRESGDELPLSFAQQRLWFIQQLETESSTYNVPSALNLKGRLNIPVLEKSLSEIVKRHEILRTTFISNSQKEPVQKIAAPQKLSLPVVDLQDLEVSEYILKKILNKLVRDAYESPFDLTKPLLRLSLIKLKQFEHILLITTHHIVSDRWSVGVFLRELSQLYNAFWNGESSPLSELPIQYGDFAIWQRQWLQGEVLENQTNYWKEKLNNLSVLELPTDRKRLPVPSYKGSHYPLSLSPELSEKLHLLSSKSGVTLFTMLLTAFQVLLHRYTHQDDIVVGTDIANRDRTEVEPLIGLFVNTLVLRTDVSQNPTFRELLQRVKEVVLGAFAHKDLPFEKLVEILNPNRDFSQMMPLFQVKFDLQLATVKPLDLNVLMVERQTYKQEFVKYELRLNLQDTKTGISGQVEYSSDLFDEKTIVRFVEHFRVLLEGIVENPDCQIGYLPLLSEAESQQILWKWNQTQREYEQNLCIHDLFEIQVEKTPDAIALVHNNCQLTYRELNNRANQLAHYLQTLGVKPESKVGVYLERNLELVIGILGILKAGAVYVPLDPAYPQVRTEYIIEDAQIEILLEGNRQQAIGKREDKQENESKIPPEPCSLLSIALKNDWEKISQYSTDNPKSGVISDNLAYLIYTSGSTGKPKGVAIAHRNTVTLLHWAREVFNDEVISGMLASTSICFDLSVFELFVPLSWGGKIILVENVLEIIDLPEASGVTAINTVPSAISQLSRVNAIPSSVNTINLAGEALQWNLVKQLQQKHPHIQQIFNLYGPSEDTTYSTYALVYKGKRQEARGNRQEARGLEEFSTSSTPPIGNAIANTQTYILDTYLQPVPIGVIGELYLGGAGLARGYFNKPDLTAEKFIPNPLNKSKVKSQKSKEGKIKEQLPITNYQLPITNLYKTGDLVRYLPSGNIEYVGRLDSQVKIRGYRIEIGEVEAALSQHPQLQESVVTVGEDGENKLLIAYVVFKDVEDKDNQISILRIRNFLSEKLPVYMIPSTFVELDELPRLPNGKINRRELSLPDTIRPELETTFVEPQTEIEKAIAKIWQDELNVERVGLQDNFFELGGHSLLGIKIIASINESLQIDVPLRGLFLNPTVAGLVEQVENVKNNQVASQSAILPKLVPDLNQRYEPFPLTDIQQAYWIGRNQAFELGNVSTHGYREIETVGLSVEQVEQALQQLINRHDMLRMIVESDGKQRIIRSAPAYEIKTLDLRASSGEEIDKELTNLRDKLSHQVLSTDEYPLFDIQAVLLSDEDNRIRFLISFDVLMGDAWSLQILALELVALIQQQNKFPPLEISFRDYVLAEKEFRNSDKYQQSLNYWQNRLATLPASPQLPLQKNPSAIETPRFIRRTHTLNPELWKKLKQRATQNNITPSGLLLAAFAEILTFWSNSPQFTLNLTLFNRLPLHPQVNQLVGDFTSSTLLEINNSGKDTFATRAKRIQAQLWSDLDNRYVSGVEVLRQLARTKGRMTGALMPVVFTSTLTQNNYEKSSINRTWQGEVVYSLSQTSQVYLDHQVSEINGALVFNWDTIDELFPSGMLDDIFASYNSFLECLENEAEWQTTTRQLLPSAQLETLTQVNATQADLVNNLINTDTQPLLHQLFFDRVALNPDKQAIVTSNQSFTYQELSNYSKTLALELQQLGVQQNQLIAVVMCKGWEQIVAVLGILTAGAAYVPIDPELPKERRFQILQQAQIKYVVTQPWLDDSLEWENGITRLVIEESLPLVPPSPCPPLSLSPTSLAYIIYTSGSTGLPKGVMISHQGAVNTILDINQRFGVTEKDWVLALSSLSFDLSVYDIFGTLAAGATIVIPDADLTKDPAHWANLIHQHQVTIWNSVPALMQLLVEHLESTEQKTDSLRLVLMSGDWIPLNLPERIWNSCTSKGTNTEIISLGGATEVSIWSIAYPIKEINPDWKSIPYGYPLTNQQFYILNEAMEPCPIWVTGQLYIGGIGLAQGYLNQPELTAQRFIPNPFFKGSRQSAVGSSEEESRKSFNYQLPITNYQLPITKLYKTGDLGRYLPDGSIEFLGREDFQVKVNGYRIELGEIETALLKNPLIQDAVVTAIGDFENKQLVAYIVPNPVEKIDFKLQQLGIRKDEGRKQIQLPQLEQDENTTQAYLRRQSYRQFLQQPINLKQFSQWIGSLAQMQLKDSPLPKYRYGSAGSLYPVQAYLHVKDNRIEGLEPGVYYYHPGNHNLILLHQESVIDNQIYASNQEIFEKSGFSLFLIAELAAITPVYGDKAKDFCMLEAGYISQLLMETAPDFDIGLCPIGILEFESIREWFNLQSSQILLHSFVGGKIDQNWTQQWMSSEPQQSMSISERLRQYLQQKLPDYMVPTHYMLLDTLPLTSNGKIDRKALPKPQLHGQSNVEYVAPETEIEKAIAQIWQNALKLKRIGIHDNFFELGGNSLSATQVITQMRQTYSIEITIRHFFEAPTIAELAQVIQQQPQQILADVETIKKVERNNSEEILENLEEMSEEDIDALLKKMMEE